MYLDMLIPLVISVPKGYQTEFDEKYANDFLPIANPLDIFFITKTKGIIKEVERMTSFGDEYSEKYKKKWYVLRYDLLEAEIKELMVDFLYCQNKIWTNEELLNYQNAFYYTKKHELHNETMIEDLKNELQNTTIFGKLHSLENRIKINPFLQFQNKEYFKSKYSQYYISEWYENPGGYYGIVNIDENLMPFTSFETFHLESFRQWNEMSIFGVAGILKMLKIVKDELGNKYKLAKYICV